ncbi:hypothetical protein ACFLUU_08020 [Chloroflexota bacterium]
MTTVRWYGVEPLKYFDRAKALRVKHYEDFAKVKERGGLRSGIRLRSRISQSRDFGCEKIIN